MRIQEIQRSDKIGSDDWQSDTRYEQVEGLKMIPGSDRYGYVDRKYTDQQRLNLVGADKSLTFYDTKPEDGDGILYIGYLELRGVEFYDVQNAVQVSNVSLDSRYRGKGIGTMMYTTALKLGYVIFADETQTPSSRRMWVNLSQIPGVSVKGIISINKMYVDADSAYSWDLEKVTKNKKRLERMGAKPMLPLENYDKHDDVTFVFPVTPGKDGKELVGRGLKIYSSKEEPAEFITAYAKWTG